MSTITKYALLFKSNHGLVVDHTDLDNYDVYTTREAAEEAIQMAYPGPVVQITIETPDPPLPTVVGSVILADTEDDVECINLVLDADLDWVAVEGYYMGEVISTGDLENVKVLFDAATVKED